MRRQPHVSGQAPILLPVRPHSIESVRECTFVTYVLSVGRSRIFPAHRTISGRMASRSEAASYRREIAKARRRQSEDDGAVLLHCRSETIGVGRSMRSTGAITQTSAESERRMSYTSRSRRMARALRSLPAIDSETTAE